ncbi:hypothetical protein AX15_005415 [Amanita polypyramis BW_CC]|nr:hypothetical protein AX15_005415 [Amanita polypyramis BW_CC]
MVTAMDHVLLYAPDIPRKYGGTSPNPPPALRVVPPCAPEVPPLPTPVAPPPAAKTHPQAALLAWAPLAPPSRTPHSFAKVAAAPPAAPALPKSVHLRKACTKQGTKATTALLCPSADGPPSNASAILDFMASKPLGKCTPISQMVTLHGDWSLTFPDALTLPDLEQLQSALDTFHHPGTEVVNRPTSTSLKFPHIPTIHPDGSAVSDLDLLEALCSHPHWRDSTLVFCEVHDSQASSTTHSLLKSTIIFSGLFITVKPGSLTGLLPSAPPAAGGVTQLTSAGLAALALQDTSFIKIECINCSGPHTATSHTCPFFTHRFNAPTLTELQKVRLHRLKEAQASKVALKPARPAKGKAKALVLFFY